MKYKLLITLLSIGLSGLVQADDETKIYYNLKGDIKSVEIGAYKAIEKFGEIEKGTFISTREHHFDNENRFTENISYDEKDTIISKWIPKRDSNGNQHSLEGYDENQQLTHIAKVTLDKNNWPNLFLLNNNKGELLQKITYENNKDGYATVTTQFDEADNIKSMEKRKLDENNFLIQKDYYDKDGQRVYTKTYINDDNGNMLSETDKDSGEVTTYEYKFDDNGNWIEQVSYKNGKPVTITIRTIEYR